MKTVKTVATVRVVTDRLRRRKAGILGQEQYVKTAVLVPLVQMEDGEFGVLFEKRAATLRRQAGEICFPGGHVNLDDPDTRTAAVRETCEELGVDEGSIEVVGDLDVLVGFGQLIVYPFAGVIAEGVKLCPNQAEVAEVFTVSLERLLHAKPDVYDMTFTHTPGDDFPYHLVPNGRQYRWRQGHVPQLFYEFDGYVIWGLTARILAHFLDLIRDLPEFTSHPRA